MPECLMVCIDNSDWMRNGDYTPSRFEAQKEAVRFLIGRYNSEHPENTIGVISSAGSRVEIHVNPTNDFAKISNAILGVKINGQTDVIRAIQTAQIALKHRLKKEHAKRIICFVGSPISSSIKKLTDLGKALRKNSVDLDVVSFGDISDNHEKLEKLTTSASRSGNRGCTFIECPSNTQKSLREFLLNSTIVPNSGGGMWDEQDVGTAGEGDFGFIPETDPDLLMALRLSLESPFTNAPDGEEANPEAVRSPQNETTQNTQTPDQDEPMPPAQTTEHVDLGDLYDDEDITPEMRAAIEASLLDYKGNEEEPSTHTQEETPPQTSSNTTVNSTPEKSNIEFTEEAPTHTAEDIYFDEAMMVEVLKNFKGIDPNDPRIKEIISSNSKKEEENSNQTDDKKDCEDS